MPNLLVAPSSPTTQPKEANLYQDYPRGYYSDGAYTALPLASSTTTNSANVGVQEDPLDPQEAYYASLLSRFADLSSTLQHPPPATLNSPRPQQWGTASQWCTHMLRWPPIPTRLASLTQDEVIQGLEILESLLTLGNLLGKRGRNIGAWAWGLLGRCREVGEMGSEEVGVVRGVGKRAAWVLRRIAAGEGGWGMDGLPEVEEEDAPGEEERIGDAEEHGDAVENGSHIMDDEEASALNEARERVIAALGTAEQTEPRLVSKVVPDQVEKNKASIEPQIETVANGRVEAEENDLHSAHATLDMIVTIIGECYGQRDLLDGRLLWEEIEWMTD